MKFDKRNGLINRDYAVVVVVRTVFVFISAAFTITPAIIIDVFEQARKYYTANYLLTNSELD